MSPNALPIPRPAAGEYLDYYGKYIALVPGDDARPVLDVQNDDAQRLLAPLTEAQALHRYAAGKWSVKEVIGHVTDAERVFAYRALRFARADETPLAGFDENRFVAAAGFDARPLPALLAEWRAVRAATRALFEGLTAAELTRVGLANDAAVSVRALAWIIAGHERHHVGLLRERYGLGR